ncbi:hypothetical protein L5515_016886 [Caenorhabditis briggsae]|uniref:Uncharacterized protein n=1 Tax=Caenorhabditis briggsae TaxID=6238 RepID=A0AAE9F7Z8_CAEBR|nr:hypothetical protein L5515_016886 [Caenorhabditis briggsae]
MTCFEEDNLYFSIDLSYLIANRYSTTGIEAFQAAHNADFGPEISSYALLTADVVSADNWPWENRTVVMEFDQLIPSTSNDLGLGKRFLFL